MTKNVVIKKMAFFLEVEIKADAVLALAAIAMITVINKNKMALLPPFNMEIPNTAVILVIINKSIFFLLNNELLRRAKNMLGYAT